MNAQTEAPTHWQAICRSKKFSTLLLEAEAAVTCRCEEYCSKWLTEVSDKRSSCRKIFYVFSNIICHSV